MRKIIFSFTMSVISLLGVDWQSFEVALRLQQKSAKIIMIEVVRTNCRYCIAMQQNVFDDKEMSQWIEARFIPVKVNLDRDVPPLDISVAMTPSFYFINKDQKIVKSIPGSWNISDFKALTKNIKGE